jgi:molybdopterin synthase sulfur carrier subunit
MTQATITVTVKLFAAYQEAVGQSEIQLSVPANTSVIAIRDRLIQNHPQLNQWQALTRYGINLNFVEPETILQDGDEVVLIPPVSGG